MSLGTSSLKTWFGISIMWVAMTPFALEVVIADAVSAPPYERFTSTQESYDCQSSMDAIVASQFGPEAKVADWETIKSLFSDNIETFCDSVGLATHMSHAWCYRNGQAWWEGGWRHYFVERHDHIFPPPETPAWLSHDNIDNHFLDLGSWCYDFSAPILVDLGLQVKVVKLEAFHNVYVLGIDNTVWEKDLFHDKPTTDCNFAAYDGDGFDLKFYLASSSFDPAWNIHTKVDWSIVGNPTPKQSRSFTGWGPHTVRIIPPVNVNKYTLQLCFEVSKDGVKYSTEPINKIIYKTLGEPQINPLKEQWFEKATLWASGAKDKESVLTKLTNGIYDGAKNCNWNYINESPDWRSLKGLGGSIVNLNCLTMANLFQGLAKVLGVSGVEPYTTTQDYGFERPFLTITPATAFDGTPGNVHPAGGNCDNCNRWFFNMHAVGKTSTGNVKYFDPTLGKSYSDLSQFIECYVKMSFKDPVTGRLRWDLDDSGNTYLLLLPGSCYDNWGRVEYYDTKTGSLLSAYQPLGLGTDVSTSEFTGSYSISTPDIDNDGRFNQLLVTAEVNNSDSNSLYVRGYIIADSNYITERNDMFSSMGTFAEIESQGLTSVDLGFSGFDIGHHAIDGPYTVHLYLIDETGVVIDQIDFNTPAYSASQFGETSADIIDANDTAIDTDANSFFDILQVVVDVNIFREGNYSLSGVITKDSQTEIVSADVNAVLPAGAHEMNLIFDGRQINKVGDVNSYTLHLVVYDANGEQQDTAVYNTKMYNPADFERKAVLISGPYSDSGSDIDGDGHFDFLTIVAGLDVKTGGYYNVVGWLQDSNGNDITYAQTDVNLASGLQSISLNFNGTAILNHKVDGPYNIIYLLVSDNNGVEIDSEREVYTTVNAYKFYDFAFSNYISQLSGEYWFGSLSANAVTFEPWAKAGTVVIDGHNWLQEWDDYNGYHNFSDTFTTTTQLDNSLNINFTDSAYNVAWDGNVIMHANNLPDSNNRLGIDIIARRAKYVDVNDFIGDYRFFGHWLGWDERWDEVEWGNANFDANGTIFVAYVSSDGYSDSFTSTWTLDDINGIVYVAGTSHPGLLCEGGIVVVFQNVAPDSLGYILFIKRTAATIAPADISGRYLVRSLESNVYGQPFTCDKGTCIIRTDGTFTVDAYYSDGEHGIFDANYTIGPGNKFNIFGDEHEGIISPDLSLIFIPEYERPEEPTEDDWIGGTFLIRTASNIADLNGDMLVNLTDYAAFANRWLNEGNDLPSDFDSDGEVDWLDLKVFVDNWLWQVSWY